VSRRRLQDGQPGFAGGLNLDADELALTPNEVRQAGNAELDLFGAIQRRQGTQRTHTTTLGGTVRAGYSWNLATGATQLVIANGKLFTATYGAFPMTYTDRGPAVTASVYPSIVGFRDGGGYAAFIADGGALNKWDGTTLTTNLASTPNATQLAVYNQRLFGITGDGETIYWSGLNNGDSLGVVASGGGSAVVRTFSDQRLTGLASIRGALLMWHVSGVSRFTGWTQDDINIAAGTEGVTSDIGSIAPRTILGMETYAVFLSERGMYRVGVSGNPELISGKVNAIFESLTATQLQTAVAVHCRARRQVWVTVSGVGTMVYHYDNNSWTGPYDQGHLTVSAAWDALDASGRPIVLLGDTNGFVKLADVDGSYKDDRLHDGTGGTVYSSTIQLHRYTFVIPEFEKSFRHATVFAEVGGGDHTISWRSDFATGQHVFVGAGAWDAPGTIWDAPGTVWDGAGVVPLHIPLSCTGYYLDLTFTSSAEGGLRISRVLSEAFQLSRRVF